MPNDIQRLFWFLAVFGGIGRKLLFKTIVTYWNEALPLSATPGFSRVVSSAQELKTVLTVFIAAQESLETVKTVSSIVAASLSPG